MEAKFVNDYEITFDRYYDWITNPISTRAQKIMKTNKIGRIVGLVCGILLIVLAILFSQLPYLVVGVIYTIYTIYAMLFKTRKLAVNQYNYILRQQRTKSWIRNIELFEDKFTVHDGKNDVDYEYSDICDFTENDEYFNLWVDEEHVVRVFKKGFKENNDDEFKSFILRNLKLD